MIRPVLTELALFLTPFALYAVFLLATRAGVLDASSWSWSTLASLTIAALAARRAAGGDPPRRSRRLQGRADRNRPRHHHGRDRASSLRGHDLAPGRPDLRPARQCTLRPRLARRC